MRAPITRMRRSPHPHPLHMLRSAEVILVLRPPEPAARQRRWLGRPENQDYFSGPEHVERVRMWRAAHPVYWRSHRRGRGVALQDALTPQVFETPEDLPSRTLQEALRLQAPILIGLIAPLSDSALQVDIATTARGLLQLGQDILSGEKGHAPQTGAAP